MAPASAQALKGAGTFNDEYKANKAAIKAAKEKKADFVAACRALPPGAPTPITGGAGTTKTSPAGRTSDFGTYKTAGQCNHEYKQAKATRGRRGDEEGLRRCVSVTAARDTHADHRRGGCARAFSDARTSNSTRASIP